MKHIHTALKVALSATFLFATMLMVMPARALDCKNVNVIFLRGSSQNYSDSVEDINFPSWFFNSTGNIEFDNTKSKNFQISEKESLKYFTSIGNRIHKEYSTLSMQFVSLHDIAGKYNSNGYKAVSAFGPLNHAFISSNAVDAKFGNFSIVQDITGDNYNESVNDGAEELAGYLEDQMVSCPSQYNIVGGFSQGAHVVGEAMKKMHDRGKDNLLSRLGHVDMYGDPKFNGYELTTSRLNPLQSHVTMPWTRGDAGPMYSGSVGPRKPYVPDILTAKTTSWCGLHDVVCGGVGALTVYDAKAHGDIYRDDNGFIDKSANEIYIDLKPRLTALAGLTDFSANSPLAYWDGIKKPQKLDIMFVIDRTGDENLSLIPDPEFIERNVAYLAEEGYTSTQAGVTTYTEFSRFDGTKDIIEPKVATPTNLTVDIFGQFGYFKATWGPAHFQNPPFGGEDLQDSPYSAITSALTQAWRPDARKVMLIFSNTWGKDTELSTNITTKQIAAKVRAKNIELLPVFTSKTFRSDAVKVKNVPSANAFWTTLAKTSSGHMTEVSGLLEETLIRDVIMGHTFAPDVEISTGKPYNVPKAKATTKNQVAAATIKNTKPVLKKAKKVTLSAKKSTSAKSKVTTYKWDLNGDGVVDQTTTTPDIETVYNDPFDGTVSVEAIAADGSSTTGHQDIQITDDDSLVTHEDPTLLDAPIITSIRSGNDVVLSWVPSEGSMVFTSPDGSIIGSSDAAAGGFTLKDAPKTEFSFFAQRVDGNNMSELVEVVIEAASESVFTIPANTDPTPDDSTPPVQDAVPPQDAASIPETTQPNDTNKTNSDTPLIVEELPNQEQLPISIQSTSSEIVIANQKPKTLPAVLGASTEIPAQATASSKLKLQKISLEFINSLGNWIAKAWQFIFALALTMLISDALLLLLLLLLILLLVEERKDKEEQTYKHNKKYIFDQKSLAKNHYIL